MILSRHKVRVIIGNDRQIKIARQSQQQRIDPILFGRVMTLKLDEEPRFASLVLAERLSVPLRLANGRFVVGVVVGLRVVQEVVRE